ncbi:monothiol glutaredoxin [Marchantia polymorpha subsp. ruderalis]
MAMAAVQARAAHVVSALGASAASSVLSSDSSSSCSVSLPPLSSARNLSQSVSALRLQRVPVRRNGNMRQSGAGSLQCRASGPQGGYGALSPEMKEALDAFIAANKVVLFMKGNKNFPQCGFSNTCVQILNQFGVPYETVNILEDDSLRQGVKEYSNWPTFPQLYIDGEFFGGCDITIEAFKSGELKETLDKAMLS